MKVKPNTFHRKSDILTSCIFLMALIFLSVPAYSQNTITVKGVVTSSSGETIPGVSVLAKGTRNSVSTNLAGEYTITVTPDATLVFSFLSMQTQEIAVNNRAIIDVILEDEGADLDEAVVIGYGIVKKSDLTGSVSSIGKEALSERVITSLEDAMRGKAAGVSITQNDGTPGSEFSMRIRGASSVNASSTPIYVIDGVIYEDAVSLSPGDVESIEILKDASSTAIYGSRGANGVIMVTTKRGKVGKVKIDFYSNFGVAQITRPYEMMNSQEYALMRYQSIWQYKSADAADAAWLSSIEHDYFRDADNNYWRVRKDSPYKDFNQYAHPDTINTDWQDAMYQNAFMQEYRISLKGGTERSKYAINATYLDEDGVVVFSGWKKYTGRMNYENQLSKKLKFSSNLALSRTEYEGWSTGSGDGVISSMLRRSPLLAINETDVNDNDDPTDVQVSGNPYYQAQHITNDRLRNAMTLRGVLDYNIFDNLKLVLTGIYVTNNNENRRFFPKTVTQGVKQNGRGIVEFTNTRKLVGEALLYYNRTFSNDHRLNIMAGATIETYKDSWLTAENQNFQSEKLGADNIDQGITPIIPNSPVDKNAYNMLSYLTRVEYGYKSRYLFTGTFRTDGSSRFAKNNKWGYFPSAAVAWRVTEEPFMQSVKTISNMKLRLSFGQSGNQAIPSYMSLSTMQLANAPMDGVNPNSGIALNSPSMPTLKWETTTSYDLGFDLGLFKNRLTFVFDAYIKKTKDLLLRRNAPYYSGYKTAWTNIGDIENRGVEFTVVGNIVNNKDFYVTADFNIAFNRSKVLKIPGGEMFFDPGVIPGSGNFVVIREGQRLGQWYGYKVDGVWKSQAEIDALPDSYTCFSYKKADIRPGDHKFVDTNGSPDGSISTEDRAILGNGEPDFTGGLTLGVGYKGFDLTTTFQYSYGADVFNVNLATLDAGQSGYNQTSHIANSWSPTLYDMSGSLVYQGNPNGQYRLAGGAAENYCLSEFIEDGSFLRLSDITLSYRFPRKWISKLKLDGLKIFVSAKNLHVWTNYFGYDPEVNTKQGGLGDFAPSLDYSAYPRSRTISGGINISF
ncbi:MAG: TonB-dependent receptor [Prevotellaceae bacterium]|jgi:TonB-linked SusC/RagA family outer membrane protein|nr:TonB-dependent receptor [Prevotellaceae bacterium]